MSKQETGIRISFWLGRDDMWIKDVLESRVRALENRGLPTTKSDEIRKILREHLSKDRHG
jgi:hypothetical protein